MIENLIPNLKNKLLWSLFLAVAVFAALMLYSDVATLGAAFRSFGWTWLLPVVALTLLNLGARYVKWEYYLHLLGVRDLARGDSVAIFLANYALILTPGKMGGLMKSYFVRLCSGTPMARTMPIILAERLTDGLGMILMTMLALVAYPAAWPVVALVIIGMVAVLVVAQVRPLALWLLSLCGRLPILRRYAAELRGFYESSYELLRLRPLLWATLLGTVARATEGVALYFVLLGLGSDNSVTLFSHAIFIAALANMIGVVVMMPGGLGGTEGSMTGLLDYFVGLAPGPATAATLIARFGTLWLPALLGFAALWWKRQRFLAPVELTAEEPSSAVGQAELVGTGD